MGETDAGLFDYEYLCSRIGLNYLVSQPTIWPFIKGLGEIRNLSTFIKFMDCKNGFSITFFFLLSVCILWIGAQFPQEIYLSYARILTLHYYCSLFICILLTKK